MTYTYGNPMTDADAHERFACARIDEAAAARRLRGAARRRHDVLVRRRPPPLDNSPAAVAARGVQRRSVRRGRRRCCRRRPTSASIVLRARADIARGRYAEAEKLLAGVGDGAARRATRRSSSACCSCISAAAPTVTRTPASASLTRGVRRTRRPICSGSAWPPARSAASRTRTASSAAPSGSRRTIRSSTPRGASCSSRSTTAPTRCKSFQAALKADETYVPAQVGLAQATVEAESAGRQVGGRSGAQGQPQLRAGAPAGRGARARRPAARRGARVDRRRRSR